MSNQHKPELTPKHLEMIEDTHRAIVGDPITKQKGLIDRVATMEKRWLILSVVCIALGAAVTSSALGFKGTIEFLSHLLTFK